MLSKQNDTTNMQQLIFSVNKPSRLFITQLQINLVHGLQKKNKEQSFGHETHPHE